MTYNFEVNMGNEVFDVEIKGAIREGEAWYLVEKQFDDAVSITLKEV